MDPHLNPARGKAPATDSVPHVDPHPEHGRDEVTRADTHLDPEWRMSLTRIFIRSQEVIMRSTSESRKKKNNRNR
jgi:hypothetical protein